MRYVLFDIDGTLTVGGSGGGAGAKALNKAFFDMFGIADGFDNVSKAGKTDPIILVDGFRQHGVEPTPENSAVFMGKYLENLEELLKVPELQSHILPGAREILDELTGMDEIHLGVLTGNWQQGARLKLGCVGLNDYFDGMGAFGDDAGTRPELVPVAWKRFRERMGKPVSAADTVIIGDTPRDVEAAHANGVRALAVTTGPFSEDDLAAAGADVILPGLADTKAAVEAILAG